MTSISRANQLDISPGDSSSTYLSREQQKTRKKRDKQGVSVPHAVQRPGGYRSYSDLASRHLRWYKTQDLRELYAISPLLVLERSYRWLLLSFCLISGYFHLYGLSGFWVPKSIVQHALLIGVRLHLFIGLCLCLYWELYRQGLEFHLSGFRILYSRGVIRKVKHSLSLEPAMRLSIKQNRFDLLFDLYRIYIWLPGMDDEKQLLVIPGLRKKDAHDLYDFLTHELSRRIALAPQALDTERLLKAEAASASSRALDAES